MLILKRFLIS
ncbi:hypothetical protein YPPY72_1854, partial [Yersinia pestis PY-72]